MTLSKSSLEIQVPTAVKGEVKSTAISATVDYIESFTHVSDSETVEIDAVHLFVPAIVFKTEGLAQDVASLAFKLICQSAVQYVVHDLRRRYVAKRFNVSARKAPGSKSDVEILITSRGQHEHPVNITLVLMFTDAITIYPEDKKPKAKEEPKS